MKTKKREMTLSEAVHRAFEESGLSVYELRRRTQSDPKDPQSGITYATAWHWANRRGRCSVLTLDRIAKALGVKVQGR